MFNFEEKTGISQAALAALITSGMLWAMPYLELPVTAVQATNGGLFIAALSVWVARQYYKRKSK